MAVRPGVAGVGGERQAARLDAAWLRLLAEADARGLGPGAWGLDGGYPLSPATLGAMAGDADITPILVDDTGSPWIPRSTG